MNCRINEFLLLSERSCTHCGNDSILAFESGRQIRLGKVCLMHKDFRWKSGVTGVARYHSYIDIRGRKKCLENDFANGPTALSETT